jgi:hypothetical protein
MGKAGIHIVFLSIIFLGSSVESWGLRQLSPSRPGELRYDQSRKWLREIDFLEIDFISRLYIIPKRNKNLT